MTIRIDKKKQQKAIANTQDFLHSNERKRRQLRLQRGIAELQNSRFSILLNSEFVETLIDHLHTEHHKTSLDSIVGVLDKIGESACSKDRELRERAVFVLSVVAEKNLHSSNHPELIEIISLHLVNWLKQETEYLAGFHFICQQLQAMLQNMLRLNLWYQTENFIIILSQIQKGVIQKPEIIRKTICQIHAGLANEAFLRKLVDVLLDTKEDRRDIAQCLLLHLGSKAAAVMVQTLIDCPDKNKRFHLIEVIPATGKVVVPICEYCLKQNPPWYVIRNLIIIISRLADPNLYDIVRPHLAHKDIRVQMQILNCITKLGGPNLRDRLIEALQLISDELKIQVVTQLGTMGGREVGNALCTLLETRDQFAVHVRDELLLTICNKIKFEPSPRTLKVIRAFVTQRKQQVDEGEKVLLAAQDALMSIELKMLPDAEADPRPARKTAEPPATDLFIVPVATEEEFDRLLQEKLATSSTSRPAGSEGGGRKTPKAALPVKTKKVEHVVAQVPNTAEMKRHCTVWSRLYSTMTEEESRAFRAALKYRAYQPGELVVARGNLEPSLHMFDTGTVRLGRNKAGEEAFLKDMGAGDLIGSDIFLSGEPWNFSLYAGKELTAHVFDLENLLRTHVEFPQLAEKILSYCSVHDILPGMLRVLDSQQAPREMAQLVKTQKPTELAKILQKQKAGLSCLAPVKHTEKLNRLLHSPLNITLRLSSGDVHTAAATVIGIVRTAARPSEAVLFAQFHKTLSDNLFLCKSIDFAEMA